MYRQMHQTVNSSVPFFIQYIDVALRNLDFDKIWLISSNRSIQKNVLLDYSSKMMDSNRNVRFHVLETVQFKRKFSNVVFYCQKTAIIYFINLL